MKRRSIGRTAAPTLTNLIKLIRDGKLNNETILPFKEANLLNATEKPSRYLNPLQHAIHFKMEGAIKALLHHGADPSLKVEAVYMRPDHDWDGGYCIFRLEDDRYEHLALCEGGRQTDKMMEDYRFIDTHDFARISKDRFEHDRRNPGNLKDMEAIICLLNDFKMSGITAIESQNYISMV
jgi:hypothetical protein